MRANRILILAVLVLTGCSTQWEGPAPAPKPAPKQNPSPIVSALLIPPGHYPPAGMCRVWIPGRPPGHQPEPTSCADALRVAPPGAWVIHRPRGKKSPLEVSFLDRERAGLVIDVRLYDSQNGVLLQGTAVSRKD